MTIANESFSVYINLQAVGYICIRPVVKSRVPGEQNIKSQYPRWKKRTWDI